MARVHLVDDDAGNGFSSLQDAVNAAILQRNRSRRGGHLNMYSRSAPCSITRSATIKGGNAGINGDGARGAETILVGPTGNWSADNLQDNSGYFTLVIDGVKMTGRSS